MRKCYNYITKKYYNNKQRGRTKKHKKHFFPPNVFTKKKNTYSHL